MGQSSNGPVRPRSVCLIQLAMSALVLPVLPVRFVHVMTLEVAGNGCAYGRKEELFAKLCEQPEPLQLVLYRILELGKAKLDAHRLQRMVQLGDCITCGDVDIGDRFRCDDQPT